MLSPFAQTLLDYIKAGYPALAVVTHEEERLLADLRTLGEAEWSYATWTVTRGWVDAEGHALNQGQGNPARALQSLGQLPEKTLAVLFDLHPYLGQFPEVLRALRDSFDVAKSSKRPVLLCSPALALPIELQKDVALLEYPLPARDTLRQLLGELLEGVHRTLPEPLIETILDAARGLTWNEAENAFALALIRDQHAPERMPATVQREKTALVRKQGVLELLDPQEALDAVGGLGPLKAWLEAQGDLLAQAVPALAWGFRPQDLPKGVLLIGVPGTGKSLVARAVAATWRLPLLRLEMSRVLGSLVGQSEAQTQQALRLAEAMAPAVLHVDEIEKALAGAGEGHLDSGVTSRVVGSLLTWLQERGLGPDGAPAPVFVVATANRVEALPPELFRPGRFDQVFFLDLPEAAERHAVFQIHLAKRRQALPAAKLGALVEATERFSPAECEQLVKTACLAAFRDGGRRVTPEDCLAARRALTPLAESRAEEIGALREWAQSRAQRANSPATPAAGRRVLDLGPQP